MATKSSKSKQLINPSHAMHTLPNDSFQTGNLVIDDAIKGKDISIDEIQQLKKAIGSFAKQHRLRSVFKCIGEECVSAATCPFIQIGRIDLLPIGKQCTVDLLIATQLYDEMCKHLIDITGSNEVDVFSESYIRELVAIELYVSRIEDIISSATNDELQFLTSMKISATNARTGDAYYEATEHYLIQTRERLLNRKDKILKALLLTPEARARYKLEKVQSVGEKIKELQSLAKNAVRDLQSKGILDLDELKKKALEDSVVLTNNQASTI